MPRKKKKPTYDPERSMEELLSALAKDYGAYDDRNNEEEHEPSLNALSVKYDLNPLKVRKLLITAGVYSTSTSRRIVSYINNGKTLHEIMELMKLSRASVNSYLPYKDTAYNMPETSVDADRARLYRKRSQAVAKLQKYVEEVAGDVDAEKELLWNCVEIFEGYRFKTVKGLPFTYVIKRNREGTVSGELFFSRKNKGVTKATVELAYERVIEARKLQKMMIPVMTTPKRLNVFGASYLYPMFIRFGLICAG